MKVYGVCRKPAVSVPTTASVKEALGVMAKEKVGAVVVIENEKAAGMFTRQDAIERVVLEKLSLESTPLSSVMTSPVEVLSKDTELADALKLMAARPFNHIPIVDSESKVVGLATTKPIMKRTIEKLSDELGSLEAYISADGIGG
jgi:CBS domain-containing protein